MVLAFENVRGQWTGDYNVVEIILVRVWKGDERLKLRF